MRLTRLVSIPVGERHFIPAEPVEGVEAPLVTKANPEGVTRTPEHHAVGKGLLEPLRDPKDN